MAHPFTTDFGARDFDAAAIADDTFIPDTFIFTAMAFPVLRRPKNAFAEQPIPFRF
ncbi:hypothetical protein HMPREF3201_02321 [Megasphaera sp. MJR8396C]|nr:hypothetical protein HMPREF3201_02321 [Megasphaera sp. MJR8396C]